MTQLDTVSQAPQERVKLAQVTLGERKYTVVDGMKVSQITLVSVLYREMLIR